MIKDRIQKNVRTLKRWNVITSLKRHGFEVTTGMVEQTLTVPDKVDTQSGGRYIAQRAITTRHVLRVVYRMEKNTMVVITFYPGLRERYED